MAAGKKQGTAMMTDKNGGPAFPCEGTFLDGSGDDFYEPGMTMRQFYKAHALAGLMANSTLVTSSTEPLVRKEILKRAGNLADAAIAEDEEFAMIAERETE